MKSKFIDGGEKYDGSQLVSLRNYLTHGILGDSIVAWVGPCDVSFEHMVDGEDLLEKATIAGGKMLHFIIEKFDSNLYFAVGLQRLFASIVKDRLMLIAGNKALAQTLFREGDDLFCGQKKLSISIATQSPVNSLIHFAMNVTNEGTPVQTACLEELEVSPDALAEQVMTAFCKEINTIQDATQKVRWVK
jgi:hypothetical protein